MILIDLPHTSTGTIAEHGIITNASTSTGNFTTVSICTLAIKRWTISFSVSQADNVTFLKALILHHLLDNLLTGDDCLIQRCARKCKHRRIWNTITRERRCSSKKILHHLIILLRLYLAVQDVNQAKRSINGDVTGTPFFDHRISMHVMIITCVRFAQTP